MEQQIPSPNKLCGSIIMYYDKGILLPAIILDQQDSGLQILRADNHRTQLNLSRVILISRERVRPDLDNLLSFMDQVKAEAPILPDIPASGLSFADLERAQDIHSDAKRFALLLSIKNHPEIYFQKHDLFFARNESERQAYLATMEQRNQRAEYLAQVAAFIQDPQVKLPEPNRKLLITQLRALLQSERIDDLHKLLLQNSPSPLKLAIKLRADLGDVSDIPDPALSASGLPICFFDKNLRIDTDLNDLPLAQQTAFTIDDADSLDFDDALSLEELVDGYLLGIHVSNLACFIAEKEELFEIAKERVSSLYLPSGNVPMLPPKYSEQIFSLIRNQDRAVLSLYARFDAQLQLQSSKIVAQKLRIGENLSYSDVDSDIQNPVIKQLHRIAQSLQELRDPVPKTEQRRYIYNLKALPDDIQVKRIDLLSPARIMIEEMMIFYNRSLAHYASKHQIPMLFRNIKRFTQPNSETMSSSAYLDTQAGYHPGIGTEAYLHATSPIRRFVDLLNQMQIHNFLQQDLICFDNERLFAMIPELEKRIQLLRGTVQKSERYWLLKYIEKKHLHRPLEGIQRGRVKGNYRVEILPWGKQVLLSMDADPEDEYFNFVAFKVDWDKMLLFADLIS